MKEFIVEISATVTAEDFDAAVKNTSDAARAMRTALDKGVFAVRIHQFNCWEVEEEEQD